MTRCLFFTLLTVVAIFVAAGDSFAQDHSPNPPLRVAVVGLVHNHVRLLFEELPRHPEIQIVGISESDQAVADKYERMFGLDGKLFYNDMDAMLTATHPQAVVVYTNTFDHRKVVEDCARRGIHVMTEKPLATTYDDALAIAKAAEAGQIHVLVNYETDWYRSNHEIYRLVHDHRLGAVRKIVAQDGHQGPIEVGLDPEFIAWLNDPKLNGDGAIFDFGCYGADLATWLMDGQRPLSVTAVAQQVRPQEYPRVHDDATIILQYPGVQAILEASWAWPDSRKTLEVFGEEGRAATLGPNQIRQRLHHEDEQRMDCPPLPAGQADHLSELRAVVLDGAQPDAQADLPTNLIVVQVLEAAQRSVEEGKTIQLNDGK